ncbi:MAG: ATP:cob(I)alamin adenosyltransferase [Bacteroidetes bacterium GWE2_29_8]|nr:MAG: ATP:cob(I)alamin adenosyltransferase [Bacteroidetes bacterium GWE2_29_8]OFY22567.1 MAG: ATP:cob(I)alamin adenosyltransferase [Bacteroidetes bacterium GWF2_29_10]
MSKIYTKTGDKGQTSILGGKRLSKDNLKIEAYGTVDEINSHVGLLRDNSNNEEIKTWLLEIQNNLFICQTNLALDPEAKLQNIPEIKEEDIKKLEKWIDNMDKDLPPLSSFILPGGHPLSSFCHIARTICRRAERDIIRYINSDRAYGNVPMVIKYINRLSDFLFTLARYFNKINDTKDIPWEKR